MSDIKFFFISAITIIAVSMIIIAGGITWLQSYNSNINEGSKSSSHEAEKGLFVPQQKI